MRGQRDGLLAAIQAVDGDRGRAATAAAAVGGGCGGHGGVEERGGDEAEGRWRAGSRSG